MEQTQTQPQTQVINPVSNDFFVTQQINPTALPQSQINDDLEALKKAEGSNTQSPSGTSLSQPIPKKKYVDPNTPQELIALHVKNPFTGE